MRRAGFLLGLPVEANPLQQRPRLQISGLPPATLSLKI
jgi:hypothetical protein